MVLKKYVCETRCKFIIQAYDAIGPPLRLHNRFTMHFGSGQVMGCEVVAGELQRIFKYSPLSRKSSPAYEFRLVHCSKF